MNERVVRMDMLSGHLQIIALEDAISELSGIGLYSEIAPRLRGGETVRLPNGLRYRAVAMLGDYGVDQLPAAAVN